MNSYERGERGRRDNYDDYRQSDQRSRNPGSARSDYGNRAYGGRLNKAGDDRGWWDRTTDEISSWLGDEEAQERRKMDERFDSRGRGESSYMYRNYPPERAYPHDWDMRSQRDSERSQLGRIRSQDVMTEDVALVRPNDSLQYAARLMGDYDCGALPVVGRQNRLIGMITDRDIAVRGVASRRNAEMAPVSEVMTDEIFACHRNDSLENCIRSMARHQVRRMPVVDDHDRIVGIISQADIAKHASERSVSGARRAVADLVGAVSEPTGQPYR